MGLYKGLPTFRQNFGSIPELVVPVAVFIGNPAIEIGKESKFCRIAQQGNFIGNCPNFVQVEAEETRSLNRHFGACRHLCLKTAAVPAFLHIELPAIMLH